jgi:sugar/nucleoside kinase (ribokinase family)
MTTRKAKTPKPPARHRAAANSTKDSTTRKSSSGKFDVMAVGDICVDLILTGNVRPQFRQVEQIVGDCSLELGGSVTIFASQLGKLGARVGIIGWTGRDPFGKFVVAGLRRAGVDTARMKTHPTLKTGIGVALSEGNDRAILTYMGTINATSPSDIEEKMLRNCQHWHVASYFLLSQMRPFWPGWLAKCKERGLTTSLDTNWDPDNRWEGVLDLLPHVDVFLPNEAEALAISGKKDVAEAGRSLAKLGPLVIVKCGEKGARAFRNGAKKDETWELHPNETTGLPAAVVDTTGAGDNFDAGFLRGWLLRREVESCLLLGHRCATGSLQYGGGTRGQLVERVTK